MQHTVCKTSLAVKYRWPPVVKPQFQYRCIGGQYFDNRCRGAHAVGIERCDHPAALASFFDVDGDIFFGNARLGNGTLNARWQCPYHCTQQQYQRYDFFQQNALHASNSWDIAFSSTDLEVPTLSRINPSPLLPKLTPSLSPSLA